MNRVGDQKSTIVLLFTSILIVGIFSFIGITFISALDKARTFSARADWRNEAILLANRLVSDPECVGYAQTIVRYTNESGTDLFIKTRVNIPLAVDRDKILFDDMINIERIDNCLRMNSPEYKLYYEIILEELDDFGEVKMEWRKSNLSPSEKSNNTVVNVQLPIKIIGDEGFNYGLFTVVMSVSFEYLQAKVL